MEVGKNAINKATGKRFVKGEAICTEGMIWCSMCKLYAAVKIAISAQQSLNLNKPMRVT
ncbi:MAG: hypothetical protein IIA61_14250 [Candidatus Marinimicrobia bacterium]|nr:hypothetical protein [Candidatus Neomarinimicrobiota bacterium]